MPGKRWGFPEIVRANLVRVLKEDWWGPREGFVEEVWHDRRGRPFRYTIAFKGGWRGTFPREDLEKLPETPYISEEIGMAGHMKRKRWGERQTGGLREDGALHPIFESGYYYATRPEWSVHMDERKVQLALLLVVMDTRDIDENADKSYPYLFEIGLLPAYPGPVHMMDVEKSVEESGDPGERLYAVERYSGTVPITDLLLEVMESDPALDSFSARKMKWVVAETKSGTVAARRGEGAHFEYPQFREEKTALEFAKVLLRAFPQLFEDIDEVLEMPVNMRGDNGYDEILEQSR